MAGARGVFMLLMSTLLFQEQCQLSVVNRRQICLFLVTNKQILGYNIQTLQLFNTLL